MSKGRIPTRSSGKLPRESGAGGYCELVEEFVCPVARWLIGAFAVCLGSDGGVADRDNGNLDNYGLYFKRDTDPTSGRFCAKWERATDDVDFFACSNTSFPIGSWYVAHPRPGHPSEGIASTSPVCRRR